MMVQNCRDDVVKLKRNTRTKKIWTLQLGEIQKGWPDVLILAKSSLSEWQLRVKNYFSYESESVH